jgi:hypothetical protein
MPGDFLNTFIAITREVSRIRRGEIPSYPFLERGSIVCVLVAENEFVERVWNTKGDQG